MRSDERDDLGELLDELAKPAPDAALRPRIRPGWVIGLLLILGAALLWRDAMGPPVDLRLRAPAMEERSVDVPSDEIEGLLEA